MRDIDDIPPFKPKKESQTPELPESHTSTARHPLQLPMHWVEMLNTLGEGVSIRNMVMRAISAYVLAYTDQTGTDSSKHEEGKTFPVLELSQTIRALRDYAKRMNEHKQKKGDSRQKWSEDHLVRIGAILIERLLGETVGDKSLYAAIQQRARKFQRSTQEEVVRILKEKIKEEG